MFREEALDSSRSRLTGVVVVDQSIRTWSIAVLIIAIFLMGGAFLSIAQVPRKETVKGFLIPDRGLVKVYSGRTGTLDALYVSEGDYVEKGTSIAKIVNSEKLTSGIEFSEALNEEIEQQIVALREEMGIFDEIYDKEMDSFLAQKSDVESSLDALVKVKDTTTRRLRIKEEQLKRHKRLLGSGHISSSEFSDSEERYLELLGTHEQIEQDISELMIQLSQIDSSIQLLPANKRLKNVAKMREISALQAKQYELSSHAAIIKSAPESGYITTIQPSIGSRVNSQSPLLRIIPEGSILDIELFLPTKSAGFIKIGDEVKVRFEAFPYQKFGMVSGSITSIDKSLILPDEKRAPIYITEPVYRVKAKLERQFINAFGQQFPLKVGMLADADVILERRSIFEWMLEPMFAVKGTFQ
ncbi:HlyD family secretion protein [Vibrio lentus]